MVFIVIYVKCEIHQDIRSVVASCQSINASVAALADEMEMSEREKERETERMKTQSQSHGDTLQSEVINFAMNTKEELPNDSRRKKNGSLSCPLCFTV